MADYDLQKGPPSFCLKFGGLGGYPPPHPLHTLFTDTPQIDLIKLSSRRAKNGIFALNKFNYLSLYQFHLQLTFDQFHGAMNVVGQQR